MILQNINLEYDLLPFDDFNNKKLVETQEYKHFYEFCKKKNFHEEDDFNNIKLKYFEYVKHEHYEKEGIDILLIK